VSKQNIGTVIRLIMSITLLALLLVFIDREALIQAFSSVDPTLYLIGLSAFVATILTWTLRWQLFMRAAGEIISFRKALATLVIGMFYSMFLPSVVGTDAGRVYELAREDRSHTTNLISTVLLDRLLGLITIAMLAVLGLLLGSQFATEQGIVFTVLGTLVVLIGGWLLVFNQRFETFVFGLLNKLPVIQRFAASLHKLYHALYQLHRQPRLLLTAGSVSLLNSFCTILATIFAARALGLEIDLVYFFIFMPIIWIIITVPVSIGGLGVREGAFVFFFTQVGVSATDAIAISLLFYSYNVIVGVLGGAQLLFTTVSQTGRKWKLEA
jgi:glycosyltransferase 2 family protein